MKRVFIGGMGRSGTTITLNAMYRHGELMAIPIETKFFVEVDGMYDLVQAVSADYSTACAVPAIERFTDLMRNRVTGLVPASYSEQHDLSSNIFRHYHAAVDEMAAVLEQRSYFADREEILAVVRRFADQTFDDLARISDKAGWVEKTPASFWRFDFLRELWPDSYFVHLLRDPRWIFCSLMEKGWLPDDLQVGLRHFSGSIDALCAKRRVMMTQERFIEVKLEHLEADPGATLDALAADLELRPFSDEAIDGVTRSIAGYARNKAESDVVRFTAEEAAEIGHALAPFIKELGYPEEFPTGLLRA